MMAIQLPKAVKKKIPQSLLSRQTVQKVRASFRLDLDLERPT
jgi:hypothetical protein